MITEDYVSFEIAKLLKEKGFDEPCECFYDTEHNDISIVNGWMNVSNSQLEEREFLCYSAPTLQMAMKWLRERHILVLPEPKSFTLDGEVATWVYNIWCGDNCEVNADFFDGEPFDNYEEACEDGIKYCLENLI